MPIVVRVLQQDLEVGDMLLPGRHAGWRPCIYLTNRNPEVYEEPLAFRPERFLGRSPDTFAWIPFGGGIRRCIGASFAQLEMKLMLRTMLGELAPAPSRRRAVRGTASGPAGGRSRSSRPPARGWSGSEGATAAAGDSFPPAMTSRLSRGA